MNLEECRGTRTREEIDNLINEDMEVKLTNPLDDYENLGEIGEGGYGKVYKVKSNTDGKEFALKSIPDVNDSELAMVVNEATLLAYLDCRELIKCIDLYHYSKNVYIVLELMD